MTGCEIASGFEYNENRRPELGLDPMNVCHSLSKAGNILFPVSPGAIVQQALHHRRQLPTGPGSAQSGDLQPDHDKCIAQCSVHHRPEYRIGDACLFRIAFGVDDFDHLADHRRREWRVERVADLDKAALLVGQQQDGAVHGGAAAARAVVTYDLGLGPAGAVADKQQVAAQRQRQSRTGQCQSNPEEECFDGVPLSQVLEAVKSRLLPVPTPLATLPIPAMAGWCRRHAG